MHAAHRSFPGPRVFVVALVLALLAHAQGDAAPDAGAKARGDYNFYGHSVHHAFTSATSHVDTYQRYLSDTHGIAMPARATTANVALDSAPLAEPAAQIASLGAVDPQIARESGDAIADDIERIQRHLSRMRERAKALGDTAALGELDDVDRQLGAARRAHAALHEQHAAEAIPPATAMELAQKVNAALRAAHAEHDEVMRRLGSPPGASVPSPAP
jgi:hypothetical protein